MSFVKNKKLVISLLAVVLVIASSWYAMAKVKNKIEDQQNRISKLEANNTAKQEEETRLAEEKKKQEYESQVLAEQQKIQQAEQIKNESLESCESRKKECPGKIASSKQAVVTSEANYKKAKQNIEKDLEKEEEDCKDKSSNNADEKIRKMVEQKCELQSSVGVVNTNSLSELESKLSDAQKQLNNTTKECANYQNPCL